MLKMTIQLMSLLMFIQPAFAAEHNLPYSCIPTVLEPQEYAAQVLPSRSRVWKIQVIRQSNQQIVGTYDVQLISDRVNLTVLASRDISLRMLGQDGYNHRAAHIQAPQLNLRSENWVCKEVPTLIF